MMDWTDRHCRYFWRLLSRRAVLYTEMVTTGALIHANPARFLDYNDDEHPVALQLGGNDPRELAHSAELGTRWGYDEINLNVGCPSDRVQNGLIGAVLMGHPAMVRDGVRAMREVTDVPVTVKHRIGIDDHDSYAFLRDFVGTVAESGCRTFIVHARKAHLQGLSPKENRTVPPLDYDRVKRLKADFPELEIVLNGGLGARDWAGHLDTVDGVMLGREVSQNPLLLAQVDSILAAHERIAESQPSAAPADGLVCRSDREVAMMVAKRMIPYIEQQTAAGVPLNRVIKPLFNLFHQVPGARQYRRYLSENAHRKGADARVFAQALDCLRERTREAHVA